MKIKRIHTVTAIMSLGHKFSFDEKEHTLNYFPEIGMFGVDSTLIPTGNVREVLVEAPKKEEPDVSSIGTTPPSDSQPTVTPSKRKSK